jgi:NitT/TauT family transport system substrate-binding protein
MSDTSTPGTPTQPQATVGDTNNTNNVDAQPTPSEGDSKKPKKKWPIFAVVGVVVLALLGAVAYAMLNKPAKESPSTSTQLTKVSMQTGWLHQAQFAGFFVAKEKGFYKDAGLDVDLKEIKDGQDLNKEVADGKIDFATSTPLEVVSARDKGQKIKAVAAIYQTSPYAFVSPKSANIKTPADLKGKTLGYVGDNPQAKVTYPALLTSYGIDMSQVTPKSVDFDIVKNFQTNAADTADIYRTDQTYLLDQAGIEYNLMPPEQFGFGIYGDVIIASDDTIKNRSGVAEKFTKATLKGFQYALDHQDEALTITAKYENELYKDPAYEKHILTNSVPLIRPTGNQPLGNMEFVPWNKAYQAIESAGQLKSDFKVNDTYTTEFID